MAYPLRFDTIYIPKPWGGRELERFKADLPPGEIGETWDVSAQAEGVSTVMNGRWAGLLLTEVISVTGTEVLGSRPEADEFPLMIRYVSSRENLSIQLHPTAAYAAKVGQPSGKDEAWYVLDASPDAYVYAGLRECTRREFYAALHNGTLEELMIRRPVRAGDFLYVPAGTVHAIGAGITLIEICENSNTTYRLYDYGRDRGLDLDDGMEVVDVDGQAEVSRGLTRKDVGYDITYLCLTDALAVSRLDIRTSFSTRTDRATFQVLTCIEGRSLLEWEWGTEELQAGQSVLLPATLGAYRLSGPATLLESHVPDVASEAAEIAGYLGV